MDGVHSTTRKMGVDDEFVKTSGNNNRAALVAIGSDRRNAINCLKCREPRTETFQQEKQQGEWGSLRPTTKMQGSTCSRGIRTLTWIWQKHHSGLCWRKCRIRIYSRQHSGEWYFLGYHPIGVQLEQHGGRCLHNDRTRAHGTRTSWKPV